MKASKSNPSQPSRCVDTQSRMRGSLKPEAILRTCLSSSISLCSKKARHESSNSRMTSGVISPGWRVGGFADDDCSTYAIFFPVRILTVLFRVIGDESDDGED